MRPPFIAPGIEGVSIYFASCGVLKYSLGEMGGGCPSCSHFLREKRVGEGRGGGRDVSFPSPTISISSVIILDIVMCGGGLWFQ